MAAANRALTTGLCNLSLKFGHLHAWIAIVFSWKIVRSPCMVPRCNQINTAISNILPDASFNVGPKLAPLMILAVLERVPHTDRVDCMIQHFFSISILVVCQSSWLPHVVMKTASVILKAFDIEFAHPGFVQNLSNADEHTVSQH
mmetsp:Transcript_2905/g.8501  ORF Transcript_2905/g.8501 Transcript_2905/m.8501 type:complete len:145 (+) Transcript_2905:2248-2682(+)